MLSNACAASPATSAASTAPPGARQGRAWRTWQQRSAGMHIRHEKGGVGVGGMFRGGAGPRSRHANFRQHRT
eukprot:137573-Chlamydomonas_euryale.AAC.1